jgi:hypothetical protein
MIWQQAAGIAIWTSTGWVRANHFLSIRLHVCVSRQEAFYGCDWEFDRFLLLILGCLLQGMEFVYPLQLTADWVTSAHRQVTLSALWAAMLLV